jgi:hypothetical protein
MRHILYHITFSTSGGQIFAWVRRYGIEAVENHSRDTLQKFVENKYACANNGILAGNDRVLDKTEAENDIKLKPEGEESKFHRKAKVHNFLEMWQRSQKFRATRRDSPTRSREIAAVGFISGTEESINPSWTNFQHDGSAAFKSSKRSPQPPALPAKENLRGRTQILNVCPIKIIVRHLA